MAYVYVLKSLLDGARYTGIALDPYARLKEHNTSIFSFFMAF